MRDIREELTHQHHEAVKSEAKVDTDAAVEIRIALPEDAEALAHCVFHSYGATYSYEWAYRPDEIKRRWSEGVMVSAVGVSGKGEVVGHYALDFDRPDSKVGESGQAVVDPRWRGHHIFESLTSFLASWANGKGLLGLYCEATAAHPYSQRGSLAIGAHETGFLIGYIPSGVEYRDILPGAARHRETAAMMYLRTNEEPERVAHVPEAFRDVVSRVYANGGFRRGIGVGEGGAEAPGTRLSVVMDPDHNAALLKPEHLGSDFHATVERELERLVQQQVDCIYLDLPVSDPSVAMHGGELDDLGFFYSCIVPEFRKDGDLLRLQLLNGVDPHIEEITTASDFGKELLQELVALMPDA